MTDNSKFLPGDPQGTYTIKAFNKSYSFSGRKVLLIIMVVAVLLRLISAVYQGNMVADLPGIYDQISYDGLARRVAGGYGFSFAEGHWPATRAGEPTAHWSYLYTLYLATIYKLFGAYPLIGRLIQALIAGVFQTLFTWRIATRIFNRTVGLIAATLNAVYIYFFYYAGGLVTETFYITCILWTFDASFRLVRDEINVAAWALWFELGLAIGLTILFRQVFLLFLPFLYIWIWWNLPEKAETPWKRRLGRSALEGLLLVTVVMALMILPFTIRNYRAFGTFVLLNTNAGFAFFWGNHPIYGTHFVPILSGDQQSYYELIPPELLSLNEADLDRALLSRGIQFVLDDPTRFFWLSISRITEFFKFWPTSESGLVSNISRVGSFGISLPFVIFGFWVEALQAWKHQSLKVRRAIVLLVCFVLFYTLIHLASWTLIRYRLPVDAVLLIFAALGIERLVQKFFLGRFQLIHV